MFGQDDKNKDRDDMPANTVAPTADATLGGIPDDTSVGATPTVPDDDKDAAAELPTVSSAGADSFMLPENDVKAPSASIPAHSDDDELLEIKREALAQLSPLVGHLDQDPEEKFRTTMMMIQASDDQSLIKTAYDAAKQIKDEKAKAQALLDIVNEINYFTQQHNN